MHPTAKYPFSLMEVGDQWWTLEPQRHVYAAAYMYGQRNRKRFTAKKYTHNGIHGCMVTRVE